MVRKGRPIPIEERALIYEKIGCSLKTLEAALTKLRKAGLYGSTDESSTTQISQKTQEDEGITEESRPTPKEGPEPKAKVEEEPEEPEEKQEEEPRAPQQEVRITLQIYLSSAESLG